MGRFTSPANRRTDRDLFDRAGRGIRRLQKQSRAELREKARKEYWDLKQLREETTD